MNQFNAPLWGDEAFSAILSMKSIPEIIKIIISDTSPPLWNISEWVVFNTLGKEEIYIRGLAFAYFLLAILFTYKIGGLLWNRKTGLLAAVLTFLNPFFFTYAFEGRMYSILALGVTASMYFFLKILRSEKKINRLDKIGYVVSTLWALYSHHFAIFVLFLQGLWVLYELAFGKRRIGVTLIKLFIAVGIGYLPWIYPLYNQTKMVGGGFWLGTPTSTDLRNIIYEYLAEGIKSHPLSIPGIGLKLHQFALYTSFGILLLRQWLKGTKKTIFLALWFLLPIAVTFTISQFFQSIFFNRYLLYTIPAAMLVLASNSRKYSGILIGTILIIFSIIDFHYFTHPTKLPFRELSIYVRQTRHDGDFLINWNSSAHHLWETKYYDIGGPIYIPGGEKLPFFVGTALMQDSDIISQIPERVNRVGVVTSGPIEEVNLAGYTESEVKRLDRLKFIWYEKAN